MIVDLARNDLGRVCEYGAVRVPALCDVEAHPGLFHLVSTVTGRLRAGVDLADVVRATFPPASVTGAPKPRVMQAIEDLEPVRRGVYCGAIGWVDGDRGAAELAVAIRTFTIAARTARSSAWAAASSPTRTPPTSGRETELKAARLLGAAGAGGRAGAAAGHRMIIWLERRAHAARATRRSRRSTTAWSSATACSRPSACTAASRSRGPVTSQRLHVSADGLGLDRAARCGAAARRRRGARRQRPDRGAAAHHGHRRSRAARFAPGARCRRRSWSSPSSSNRPSDTASVMIVPWTRNEGGALAGLKTISYAENVRALAYVEERGAHEAIFANTQGNLCEATGSNVFLVLDGQCCTPPLSAGCLNGVTRQLLLEIAREVGVPIEEHDVPVDALRRADEAFVTSTVREVQPIATVDGVALPSRPDRSPRGSRPPSPTSRDPDRSNP